MVCLWGFFCNLHSKKTHNGGNERTGFYYHGCKTYRTYSLTFLALDFLFFFSSPLQKTWLPVWKCVDESGETHILLKIKISGNTELLNKELWGFFWWGWFYCLTKDLADFRMTHNIWGGGAGMYSLMQSLASGYTRYKWVKKNFHNLKLKKSNL